MHNKRGGFDAVELMSTIGPLSRPLPNGERRFVPSRRHAIKVELRWSSSGVLGLLTRVSSSAGIRLLARVRATLLSLLGLSVFLVTASAQQSTPVALTNATVVEIEGVVEVLKLGAAAWQPARTNGVMLPGDRLRAGEHSRALLRVSPLQTIRVGEFGLIEMPREDSRFGFLRGIFYFFHRDKPGTLPLRTPAAMAVI